MTSLRSSRTADLAAPPTLTPFTTSTFHQSQDPETTRHFSPHPLVTIRGGELGNNNNNNNGMGVYIERELGRAAPQ